MRDPIPRTSIQTYYKAVCKMSYASRLIESERLLQDPSPLIEKFDSSIKKFDAWDNQEGFYSNPKRAPKWSEGPSEIRKTHHVAWYLRRQQSLRVKDDSALSARYVDYEIAPTRATGGVKFEGGGTWRSGVFVDLLLASSGDPHPIIGELKIRADKDPFTGLVQMLSCAALFSTRNQYRRLCDFMPAGEFMMRDEPLLDGYILLYKFLEVEQGQLRELGKRAELLSESLMQSNPIRERLRRVACLDLDLDSEGTISARKRWRHDGVPDAA